MIPNPVPALHIPRDESSWRPAILEAAVDGDSGSAMWTPIGFNNIYGETSVRSETPPFQPRPLRTDELLSEAPLDTDFDSYRSSFPATPRTRSLPMFDQILRAPPPRPNFHPVHATKFVRRLVLAKMAPIVDIYLRQTYSLTIKAMQNISKIADFDPQRLGEKPWQDEWRSEFFNRLWELRGNIELLGFDMESTIRLFQDLADGTSWPEMLNLDMADGGRWRDERRWKHRQIRDQDLDDLEEWKRLEATRKYAAGFIERTTNSYLQAATAEGAKFANLQAKRYVRDHAYLLWFSDSNGTLMIPRSSKKITL